MADGTVPAAAVERLARATTQAWAAPGVVDLGVGQPHEALLPVELLARAASELPAQERHPLQYGAEYGDGYLRLALGALLARRYGIPVDPEALFVTNGNSQAIDLACSVLARPGDVVFVEEPTYFLALDIFRQHGLRVVGIPVDTDGLSIDALTDALTRDRPAFVYTIPAFQNPTGVTLSPARRARLVELAEDHGFVVLADEVYQLLRYRGDDVAPMAAFVDRGVVVSMGTFSKILAPGLRLGWLQAARPLLDRFAAAGFIRSGGGLNPFASAVVRRVIESGDQDRHLERLRAEYLLRLEAMVAALRDSFPAEASYRVPDGGYFCWVRFPNGIDTADWSTAATTASIGFRPGSLFSASGGCRDHLRLSFAFYDADTIGAAVRTLGAIVSGHGPLGDSP